jgi:hypothetical protein
MGAGSAGADDGEVGSLGTELDGDYTPGDIRDERGYHERRYSPRPFLKEYSKLTLDRFQSAYARANQHSSSLGFEVFFGQARIGHGTTGSSKGEVHVTIVSADLLGIHLGRGIEIRYLGSDLAGNIGRVETSYGADAGTTNYERIPERVYVTSNGGKNTKTSDDYARVGFSRRHGTADILEKTPREVQKKSACCLRIDISDYGPNGLKLLSFFLGNVFTKFLFQGHHQFDLIEGICTEIVYETGLRCDLLVGDVELIADDFLYSVCVAI